ncbi:hypothetical protein CLOM_g24048 [Closterium sp. NIES-68]|nr:hypothetical protein CLOM_g24048 [Closterium sp. NIES-68]GJP77069.1 hypothetical protein CLOP_g7502 [Closterium sp. NIES-67]
MASRSRRHVEEPDLQVLPPHVWGTIGGLGLAATALLFAILGVATDWEVPGLPYLYNGLFALSVVLCAVVMPLAWSQLPSDMRARLKWKRRTKDVQVTMDPPPWAASAAAVCRILHVVEASGLPREVAGARLLKHGRNEYETMPVPSFPLFLLAHLYSPARLLLLALLVLFAGLTPPEEATLGALCTLALLLLHLYAEWRGRLRLAAASLAAPHDALVLRDGAAVAVSRVELVPGDVVLLRSGMEVPADLRLLHCTLLEIDESGVSGEWEAAPCPKDASLVLDPSAKASPIGCQNIALAGTMVTCGYGSGVVFRTGMQTEIGKKLASVSHVHAMWIGGGGESSPLLLLLRSASRQVAFASVGVGLLAAALGLFQQQPWQDVVLVSLVLFFATLPDDLPAMLYSTLGACSHRLEANEIFFQQMKAIENLSFVDTILTDKTGCLTENKLSLHELLVADKPVGAEDIAEATRLVPKTGPLAEEGAMGALGRLFEAWVFMSDMGDDLLRDSTGLSSSRRRTTASSSAGAGLSSPSSASAAAAVVAGTSASGASSAGSSAVGDSSVSASNEAEFLARVAKEAKEAGAGAALQIDIGESEEQSESLLQGGPAPTAPKGPGGGAGAGAGAGAGTRTVRTSTATGVSTADVAARGGHVDALDWAILAAVGGPSVLTSLPYEGLEGEEEADVAAAAAAVASTRGLRPLHDMLRRCYEAKAAADRLADTPYDAVLKCATRTYANVPVAVAGGGVAAAASKRGKSVQQKLLALGRRAAAQNGAGMEAGETAGLRPAPAAAAAGGGGGDGDVCERVYVRGPPEVLVEQCGSVLCHGEPESIASLRPALLQRIQALADEGYTLVGYASGSTAGDSPRHSTSRTALLSSIADCTFLGLVALSDPTRVDAADAARCCRLAGVRPVLVTGDHLGTAVAVARAAAICYPHQVAQQEVQQDAVSCAEHPPAQSTGEELRALVAGTSVLARASPTDKLCILEALQMNGQLVAACGSSLTDASVLAAADVGIAVGPAPAAVRDAASVVLLDPSFGAVRFLLEEARAALANVRKALALELGCKLGLALVVLVGTLWLSYPMLPCQLIVSAVLLRGASLFLYTSEPPDSDVMLHAPRRPTRPFFDLPLLATVAAAAIATAVATLLSLAYSIRTNPHNNSDTHTVAFIGWLVSSCFVSFHLRTTSESLFHKGLFSNPAVLLGLLVTATLCVLLSFSSWFRQALHFQQIPPLDWLVVVGIAAAGTIWIELIKCVISFYRDRGYEVPTFEIAGGPGAGAGGGGRDATGGDGGADGDGRGDAEGGDESLLPSSNLKSDIEMT